MGVCQGKTKQKDDSQPPLEQTSVRSNQQRINRAKINRKSPNQVIKFLHPNVNGRKDSQDSCQKGEKFQTSIKHLDNFQLHSQIDEVFEVTDQMLVPVQNKRDHRKNLQFIQSDNDFQVYEQFTEKKKKISEEDKKSILKILNRTQIFAKTNQNILEEIMEKMKYCQVKENEFLFKQGSKGSRYFLLDKGQCNLIIDGIIIKTLNPGDCFGERALLYNDVRTASIQAISDCYFWSIDRNSFKQVTYEKNRAEFEENFALLQKVRALQFLTQQQKEVICNNVINLTYKQGDIIFKQGELAQTLIVLKKGQAVAIDEQDKEQKIFKPGDYFGESGFFSNSVRAVTVKAIWPLVICLAISRKSMAKIFGEKLEALLISNQLRKIIDQDLILKRLTKLQKEKIMMDWKREEKKKDEVVLEKNQCCDKLIMLLEGGLKFQQYRNSGTKLKPNVAVFLELIIYENLIKICCILRNFQLLFYESILDNLIMTENGVIATLDSEIFFKKLGCQDLESILEKISHSHEDLLNKVASDKTPVSAKIFLEDFYIIKKIRKEKQGDLYLVENRNNNKLYQIFVIQKKKILDENLEELVQNCREALLILEFPFFKEFIRTFKDQHRIYFLFTHVRGMQLYDVLKETGTLNIFDARFYVGSLILCLEYLHIHGVIHRGIYPEMITVAEDGYILLNFSLSHKLQSNGRFRTVVGSPHYMAPEIINNNGYYSFASDLWSLGVCFHEFVLNQLPFGEDFEDPYDIYQEIIQKNKIVFPSYFKDRSAKLLISQLLNIIPERRLGGSYAALKNHEFFDGFDYDNLIMKLYEPPYKPPKFKLEDKKINQQTDANSLKSKKPKKNLHTQSIQYDLRINQDNYYRDDEARVLGWDSEF